MELSAGRQTLNMKAFILTMALVYVQQCEFAYLTDMFIGSLCLAMPPFHVMITHFLFVTPSYEFDFIDFYNDDISINFPSRYKHGLLAMLDSA